jgi:hypothetical protein
VRVGEGVARELLTCSHKERKREEWEAVSRLFPVHEGGGLPESC